MAYLVRPFTHRPLHEAFDQLDQANRILRNSVERFVRTLRIPESREWACDAKRLHVEILLSSADSCPLLEVKKHDYGEIIDQCATLQRLMDAIQWAFDHLPDHSHVVSCDPTQSSEGEADLIIKSPDSIAMFEVSDIIGTAFQAKVRKQTIRLRHARAILQALHPDHSIRTFIAMNADGSPPAGSLIGTTAIWEIGVPSPSE